MLLFVSSFLTQLCERLELVQIFFLYRKENAVVEELRDLWGNTYGDLSRGHHYGGRGHDESCTIKRLERKQADDPNKGLYCELKNKPIRHFDDDGDFLG